MEMTLTVSEYYAGKQIFLTGATGFVGKVLLEKLLRCCPDVDAIYCLIRTKKNQNASDRLRNLLHDKLYDTLKEHRSSCFNKVHAIQGDVSEENLGISDKDRQLLIEHVNIIFHSAATVKFDENLKSALHMNVLGVRKILELCRQLKNLDAFVHTSTAYSNCNQSYIEEIVYPPLIGPSDLLNTAKWMDADMMQIIAPNLMSPMPNTYIFTKQLAESLLASEGEGLPIAIVRPSIVTATWKEPVQGYIDNINGPSGIMVVGGKGLLRSVYLPSTCLIDCIPVDVAVNSLIAVAWYTAVVKPCRLLVYNITMGNLNSMSLHQQVEIGIDCVTRNPLNACLRCPGGYLNEKKWVHNFLAFINHTIPALLIDLICRILGKKLRLMIIYNKMNKMLNMLEYFMHNKWNWSRQNVDMLNKMLSANDKQIFYTDARDLHWPAYIESYCLGLKTYFLKEDINDLPAARAHLRRVRNIHLMLKFVGLIILCYGLILLLSLLL